MSLLTVFADVHAGPCQVHRVEVLERCVRRWVEWNLFGGLNTTSAISQAADLGQANNLSKHGILPSQTPCGCCGDSTHMNIFAQSLGTLAWLPSRRLLSFLCDRAHVALSPEGAPQDCLPYYVILALKGYLWPSIQEGLTVEPFIRDPGWLS